MSPIIKSRSPRLVLNELKWKGYDLNKCRIYYVHRGAPDDTKIVEGNAIKDIDRGFMILEGVVQDVYIPYHRIFRIEFDNRIVYERRKTGYY
ncbi:MAG: DUF504 domain-containing protein [Candidatus Methanoperedenaceae archaeon]|nr:DUF504 domain-containing protein [Candidatus Methanoperedenaceae archaeon]MDW7726075.1 RNA repair domain-containing protein [Candidatus Methanoperedens sp.]